MWWHEVCLAFLCDCAKASLWANPMLLSVQFKHFWAMTNFNNWMSILSWSIVLGSDRNSTTKVEESAMFGVNLQLVILAPVTSKQVSESEHEKAQLCCWWTWQVADNLSSLCRSCMVLLWFITSVICLGGQMTVQQWKVFQNNSTLTSCVHAVLLHRWKLMHGLGGVSLCIWHQSLLCQSLIPIWANDWWSCMGLAEASVLLPWMRHTVFQVGLLCAETLRMDAGASCLFHTPCRRTESVAMAVSIDTNWNILFRRIPPAPNKCISVHSGWTKWDVSIESSSIKYYAKLLSHEMTRSVLRLLINMKNWSISLKIWTSWNSPIPPLQLLQNVDFHDSEWPHAPWNLPS